MRVLGTSIDIPADLPNSVSFEHAPFVAWLVRYLKPGLIVDLSSPFGYFHVAACRTVRDEGLETRCYSAASPDSGERNVDQQDLDGNATHIAATDLPHLICKDPLLTIGNGTVDILHLDATSLADVKGKFERWIPKLSARATLLINGLQGTDAETALYFADFSEHLRTFHFSHHGGMTVVFWGNRLSDAAGGLVSLLLDEDRRVLFSNIFEALGERADESRNFRRRLKLMEATNDDLVMEREASLLEMEALHAAAVWIASDAEIAERHSFRMFWRRMAYGATKLLRKLLALTPLFSKRRADRLLQKYDPKRFRDALKNPSEANKRRNASLGEVAMKKHKSKILGIKTYKILLALSKISRPFSTRRAERFLQSAIKRYAPYHTSGKCPELEAHWAEGRGLGIGYENKYIELERINAHQYRRWIKQYSAARVSGNTQDPAAGPAGPKISVIMPVYNAPVQWLEKAIDSVIAQTHENWELCIADDCSTDSATKRCLENYAARDPRIKVVFREKNGHISAASNSALDLATGEWMALLDQDDVLVPHALSEVAKAIRANPGCILVYSDEDKIDEADERFDPYFKPDWNLELFRSQNYICHLGTYKLDLVREIGGFRTGVEGSQDYDLALRVVERAEKGEIVHIPEVLYHWRSHPQSTASTISNKNYAVDAGQTALKDHLERSGIVGDVEILPTGMYRTRYALPDDLPAVSIIIPTRNSEALVRQCIESLLRLTTYKNFEILLVDNGSDDPSALAYFSKINDGQRIRVIRDDRPFNYSQLNNEAAGAARGEYLVLMNNDIEIISPSWLEELISFAQQPDIGAVGARLWYPDYRLQHGGVVLGIGGVAGHFHKFLPRGKHGYFSRAELPQEFSAVTAACLAVNKEKYFEVGGLDAENLKVAFNDVDFCLRLQQLGYRNVWTPYAELLHHESASRGQEDTPAKRARFAKEVKFMLERWEGVLTSDRAYNPNLTLEREAIELAFPPRRLICSPKTSV